jgi:hypothetical protein
VVVETCGDEKAPIILDRPFLSSATAIMYADSAKICFTIKDRKERFTLRIGHCNLLLICKRRTYTRTRSREEEE